MSLPNCVAEEERLFRENDTPYKELIQKAEETLSLAQTNNIKDLVKKLNNAYDTRQNTQN